MGEESVCTCIDSVHPGKGVRIISDCQQVLVAKKKKAAQVHCVCSVFVLTPLSTMHTRECVRVFKKICTVKSDLLTFVKKAGKPIALKKTN